jgi:hypothetical protein
LSIPTEMEDMLSLTRENGSRKGFRLNGIKQTLFKNFFNSINIFEILL